MLYCFSQWFQCAWSLSLCSPDLNPNSYFMWGFLKDCIYHNNTDSLEELQAVIEAIIGIIDENILAETVQCFFLCFQRLQMLQVSILKTFSSAKIFIHYFFLTSSAMLCWEYLWKYTHLKLYCLFLNTLHTTLQKCPTYIEDEWFFQSSCNSSFTLHNNYTKTNTNYSAYFYNILIQKHTVVFLR